MSDAPFLPIIDRHTAMVHSQQYHAQLSLLEDLVNYGSNLLPRCFHSSDKSTAHSILLFHMAREVLIQLDTLHALLKAGCVPGCASVARSLVEKSHLLFWSLKQDTELKMKYLFVGGLRSAMRITRIASPSHKEHQALNAEQQVSLMSTEIPGQAKVELESFGERLGAADVSSLNAEFEALAGKLGYEPSWTKAYCKKWNCGNTGSAKGIAKELNRMDEYAIHFEDYSSVTHGQALLDSMRIRAENIDVINVRDGRDFEELYFLTKNTAIDVYKALLEAYRPGEIENFGRKYFDQWKPRMLR